jgi:hypothetical protein
LVGEWTGLVKIAHITSLFFAVGTPPDLGRVMHAQQGVVDFQVSVVIDESQLTEFVHEGAHTRPCGADHLCERLLADIRYDRLWFQ